MKNSLRVCFFEGGTFSKGYEIGLSSGGQKIIRRTSPGKSQDLESTLHYTSKRDRLFPVEGDNPASYQRLVLTDTE